MGDEKCRHCGQPEDGRLHLGRRGMHRGAEIGTFHYFEAAPPDDGDIVALMKSLEPFDRGSVLAGLSRAYTAGVTASVAAAEQAMNDAKAADYEPEEVCRFMLDAIAARGKGTVIK